MNLIEFKGLRRSGNHAIIFWMLQNLSKQKEVIPFPDNKIYKSGNCLYLNDYGFSDFHNFQSKTYLLPKLIKMYNCEWCIVSYEDVHIDYKETYNFKYDKLFTFSIVRDIENILSSRLKYIDNRIKTNESINNLNIYDNIFIDYISHKNYNNSIVYDKWVIDKEYRDSICKQLNVENLDHTDYVSFAGYGSSFVGITLDNPDNLLNRKKMFTIPDKYIKKLKELQLI